MVVSNGKYLLSSENVLYLSPKSLRAEAKLGPVVLKKNNQQTEQKTLKQSDLREQGD